MKKLVNEEYTVLEEYKNTDTPIKMKHNKCGYIYKVAPHNFLSGQRCPNCLINSKGENRIEEWLIKNDYLYKKRFTFEDCKYKKVLPFDFMLEDDSGKIILIEFDGIQHFKKCWYDTDEDFKIRQLRDKIKTDYCNKRSDIDLYRIRYDKYEQIESIMESIVEKYN